VDLVDYRGYFIHIRSEAFSWRFMAAPAMADLPIFSRAVSRQFSSREEALADAETQIDRLLAG
jgi:hypothetical protein